MNSKYEIKTYLEGIHKEISDLEIDKKINGINENLTNKTDIEQDNFIQTNFQPKCFFTNQNNNISFYQSNSKSSFRKSKNYKSVRPLIDTKNSSSTGYTSTQSFGEEQFSYNYTALKRDSSNRAREKNECQNAQRMNIAQLNNKFKKPKREIESYKKQFNMQKSDNFNMLSYKPMEFNSDINFDLRKKKTKINQIYKKQEVDNFFFPSKKTHSPHYTIEKNDTKDKFKILPLKYHKFFWTDNGNKNTRVSKSTSKLKINQLNDFNIDKLIEIGDKYVNLHKPVLPLGKRMNSKIMYYNKIKYNKNKILYNEMIYNNYSSDRQFTPIFSKFNKRNEDSQKKGKNINKTNIIKGKKRVTKKVVSKNFLNNSKLCKDENREDISTNSITKVLNFNNEIFNNDINTIKKFKKKYVAKSRKEIEYSNNIEKNIEMQNKQEIKPNINMFKRKTYLNLYEKHKGINTYTNKTEKNIINNNRNEKQIVKNLLSEPKLLTDEQKNYRSKILNKKNILINKEKLVTESKQYNKDSKIMSNSNIYYKHTKQKNFCDNKNKHNPEDFFEHNSYF